MNGRRRRGKEGRVERKEGNPRVSIRFSQGLARPKMVVGRERGQGTILFPPVQLAMSRIGNINEWLMPNEPNPLLLYVRMRGRRGTRE